MMTDLQPAIIPGTRASISPQSNFAPPRLIELLADEKDGAARESEGSSS